MTEQSLRSLLHEVASNAVPDNADLWQSISRSVERRGAGSRRPWPIRHIRLVQTLPVVVLTTLLVAATPGRSVVGSALSLGYGQVQRFGTVLVGPEGLPGRSHPPERAGAQPTALPPVQLTPIPTLAEALQQVAFHIRTPAGLPPGVVFRYVFVFPGASGVVVSYRAIDDPSKGMGVETRQGAPAGGYAIPSSAAQNVTVHGHPAVYAHGSWNERREWRGDADSAMLSWEEDGFTYILHYSGLGLSRADMIRIAESMQ